MVDIKIVVSGVCSICGHTQEAHEGNLGCTAPSKDDPTHPCLCDKIGSY